MTYLSILFKVYSYKAAEIAAKIKHIFFCNLILNNQIEKSGDAAFSAA